MPCSVAGVAIHCQTRRQDCRVAQLISSLDAQKAIKQHCTDIIDGTDSKCAAFDKPFADKIHWQKCYRRGNLLESRRSQSSESMCKLELV